MATVRLRPRLNTERRDDAQRFSLPVAETVDT